MSFTIKQRNLGITGFQIFFFNAQDWGGALYSTWMGASPNTMNVKYGQNVIVSMNKQVQKVTTGKCFEYTGNQSQTQCIFKNYAKVFYEGKHIKILHFSYCFSV